MGARSGFGTHLHQGVALNLEENLATRPAIGTGGANLADLLVDDGHQTILLVQSAGGAIIDTGSTIDAFVVENQLDPQRAALLVE